MCEGAYEHYHNIFQPMTQAFQSGEITHDLYSPIKRYIFEYALTMWKSQRLNS